MWVKIDMFEERVPDESLLRVSLRVVRGKGL